jgi:long-chain acyl-CoA synthetase
MGYVDEDGYLYLTDRSTFMIVSGGVNIYPQEAENTSEFRTRNSARRSRPWCNRPPPSRRAPNSRPSSSRTAERLAAYKCPRTVEFDPELPRDPNGKLYKRWIRERYWQGRSSRNL